MKKMVAPPTKPLMMAPYGLNDLFEKVVKPTPLFKLDNSLYPIYSERAYAGEKVEVGLERFIYRYVTADSLLEETL